ncbi:hypothetical protein [Cohnella boryungensis]|uniref:SLH domain-containing protein n=1 Tax=Cohnella boryungensis TaxID=768479 RepID=A0ABV8S316_9BACL
MGELRIHRTDLIGMNGRTSNKLVPQGSMTRAEVAATLQRLLQKVGPIN